MDEEEKNLLNRALGEIIKGARGTEGLTQRELAAASGVNYETLKNIEKGQHKISVLQVAQLAEALHEPATEFVARAMRRYESLLTREPDRDTVSEGSTTTSTESPLKDPATMTGPELDELRKQDVALAAHPVDAESENDEQYP